MQNFRVRQIAADFNGILVANGVRRCIEVINKTNDCILLIDVRLEVRRAVMRHDSISSEAKNSVRMASSQRRRILGKKNVESSKDFIERFVHGNAKVIDIGCFIVIQVTETKNFAYVARKQRSNWNRRSIWRVVGQAARRMVGHMS